MYIITSITLEFSIQSKYQEFLDSCVKYVLLCVINPNFVSQASQGPSEKKELERHRHQQVPHLHPPDELQAQSDHRDQLCLTPRDRDHLPQWRHRKS